MVAAAPRIASRFLPDRSRSRIGADIGTRMLKFAQCRRVFGKWKLAAAHVLPVLSQQTADATGLGAGVVGQALDGVSLRPSGFEGTSAVAALSSAVAWPRRIELPDGEDAELLEMVNEECDASESCSVDFWRSRSAERGTSTMIQVDAVVLPKEQALHCAQGLTYAGLHCDAISVQSLAMARAVQLIEATDRPIAAVDWGATAPLLCVCRNGQAEFTRVLRHCGLRSAVEAISTDMGIGELDVAQLLISYGVDSARHAGGTIGSRLDVMLCDHVRRFQDELIKTLEFLRQHLPESVPDSICLFGGGATIAGIAARLSDQTRVETRSWKLEPSQLDPGLHALEFQSLFGVAVGLSILETDQ